MEGGTALEEWGWFQGGGPEENSGVTGAHLVLMAIAGQ